MFTKVIEMSEMERDCYFMWCFLDGNSNPMEESKFNEWKESLNARKKEIRNHK